MVELLLPFPPSANNLYPTAGNRRIVSREYKAWLDEAGYALKSQNPESVKGRVRVLYEYHRPDNRRRDLSNLEKAVSDLLVKHGILEDDCLIWEATLRWTEDHPGKVRAVIDAL